jgi:integrase
MKHCIYCERDMKPQNYNKHMDHCFIKREFNLPKSEILKAIGGKPNEKSPEEFENLNHKLSADNIKCMDFVKKVLDLGNGIMVACGSDFDAIEKINEMQLNPETIKEYQSEWKLYSSWCFKKKLNTFQSNSANSYLSGLNKETSTIKKKRCRLQSILKHLTGQSVVLSRIRRRVKRTPKYALSPKEIENYLKEQKSIDDEDYLIQLILCTYGCRIHAISNLQLKHLEFLNGEGNNMFLPDTKTGIFEVEVDKSLQKLLKKFIIKMNITQFNEFVFSAGSSDNLRVRSISMCMRINKRIKESKVLKKSPNFKFSSHMFRKTKAFQIYREYLEKGKEAARSAIGHEPGSSSINFYIN